MRPQQHDLHLADGFGYSCLMRPAVLLLALLASACGRTMNEADCRKVAESMRVVWLDEAKRALPPEGPATEKAASVIQSEADKLVVEWSAECKKELEGRRVDAKELDCLLRAKSVEDIHKCAEL
jgi:hypothetical protein